MASQPALLTRVRSPRTKTQLQLVLRLAQRQLASRYKETAFGLTWTLLSAFILLAIYSFVFVGVWGSKWTTPDGSEGNFALYLFSGLLFFNFWSEIVNSSTYLISGNAALVKRTTVSSRVLPLASSLSSLFTLGLTTVAFLIFYLIAEGVPPATALLTPLLVIPLLVLCTGVALILSSVAVYFRDVQQLIPLVNTAVLFLSPIFAPLTAYPEAIQKVLLLLPLGVILPASKDLLFNGQIPPLLPLAVYSLAACLIFALGWVFFGRASRGFADVI
jgi:lipopolysaccharide transport system permease protein